MCHYCTLRVIIPSWLLFAVINGILIFGVAICIPVVFCVLIIQLPMFFPLYLFLSMPVSQNLLCFFSTVSHISRLFLSCVFKFFLISLTYLSRSFILDYKGILPRFHTWLFLPLMQILGIELMSCAYKATTLLA